MFKRLLCIFGFHEYKESRKYNYGNIGWSLFYCGICGKPEIYKIWRK